MAANTIVLPETSAALARLTLQNARVHFHKSPTLPPQGVVCARCRRVSWARPYQILYARGRDSRHNEYARTSGQWVICTICIPPRLWLKFFTKHDTLELIREDTAHYA